MKFRVALIVVALSSLLLGCNSTQLAKFQAGVNNFIQGVQTVDTAVASVNATLYKNCNSIYTTGVAVATLPKSCSKASLALAGINASIANYCQAEQVSNISTAVAGSAAAYNAGRAAYEAAKAACKT